MMKLTAARKVLLSTVMGVALSAALAGSAYADPPHRHYDRGNHYGWRNHDRHWRGHRPHRVYYPAYRQHYVYSPPPVVYYPPAPSPGINFVIPLRFD